MRYLIPALAIASPALAHSTDLPHSHSADWAIPAALFLTGAAVLIARRRTVRARTRK